MGGELRRSCQTRLHCLRSSLLYPTWKTDFVCVFFSSAFLISELVWDLGQNCQAEQTKFWEGQSALCTTWSLFLLWHLTENGNIVLLRSLRTLRCCSVYIICFFKLQLKLAIPYLTNLSSSALTPPVANFLSPGQIKICICTWCKLTHLKRYPNLVKQISGRL